MNHKTLEDKIIEQMRKYNRPIPSTVISLNTDEPNFKVVRKMSRMRKNGRIRAVTAKKVRFFELND